MVTSIAPGTLINDRYYVVRAVRQVEFGWLYTATDQQRFGKLSWLEEFWPQPGEDLDQLVPLFQAQIHSLCQIQHGQIPQHRTFLAAVDRLFLVTDCSADLSVETARTWLTQKQQIREVVTEQEAFSILLASLRLLDFLHARSRVHGNVCLESVLLSATQLPILMHFGQVRSMALAFGFRTMLPVDTDWELSEDPIVDVYDLAVMIIALLTGQANVSAALLGWTTQVTIHPMFVHVLQSMLAHRFTNAASVLAFLSTQESDLLPSASLPVGMHQELDLVTTVSSPIRGSRVNAQSVRSQVPSVQQRSQLSAPLWKSVMQSGLKITIRGFLWLYDRSRLGIQTLVQKTSQRSLANHPTPKLNNKLSNVDRPLIQDRIFWLLLAAFVLGLSLMSWRLWRSWQPAPGMIIPTGQSSPQITTPELSTPEITNAQTSLETSEPPILNASPQELVQINQAAQELAISPILMASIVNELKPASTQSDKAQLQDVTQKLSTLSLGARSGLGSYYRVNFDRWLVQAKIKDVASIAKVADRQFYDWFPSQVNRTLNPRTLGQVWYAIAHDVIAARSRNKSSHPNPEETLKAATP